MSKITVLDQNTINQIAAGEVIERPAAVVKELVENSIDAGANAITVEIKEGGISFIRITDNGSGIEEDDMPFVFLRHSTSKIKTAEDLLSVSSLGFRGEALSSIAAIAQVELITKTSDSFTGIRYTISGGEEKGYEHIGCPNGTTFIIRNLFFNTPARRKFLKTPVTESGYISDLMERLAVSHPNISFKFINNGQVKLHTSGNNNLKDILYNVYGRDIASHLIPVEGNSEQIKLNGFIAKPIVSRGNRNYENYFINGRYIKSAMISKAIEEAYKPYIMSHRYPFTSLFLKVDSELIDVNVHPAKLEIRFKNSEDLYQLIYRGIKNALEGKELIPEVALTQTIINKTPVQKIPEPFEERRRNTNKEISKETEIGKLEHIVSHASSLLKESIIYSEQDDKDVSHENKWSDIEHNEIQTEKIQTDEVRTNEVETDKTLNNDLSILNSIKTSNEVTDNSNRFNDVIESDDGTRNATSSLGYNYEQISFISEEATKNHRIIGQIFSTYWLVEFDDKMFIIDQHAAHEKVLYEKIMKDLKEKQYNSQMLEPPIILTLNIREEEALKTYMDTLNRLGFEIEEFGGKEYAVRSIPSDLFGLAQQEILIEIIDGLVEEVYHNTPEMILEKIASMSCKAAVKGNYSLSSEEARSLIKQLLTLENPYNCPHGRPTIISMSKYEIEKKFKRIV